MAHQYKVGSDLQLCRRHRWTFICWVGDESPDLPCHRIDRCRCCPLARVTAWRNGAKARASVYAENLNEAILGAKLSEFEGELALSRVSVN
jgi:hypothetical protein